MPTASGKTLVAYIALLVSALKNGKGLYIVPLKALASEKYSELKEFEKLGIKVGIATGDYDSPSKYLENYDIIISTTEKADSLMRHNTSLLEKFNVLIIDEIHLLNDFMRGPTLEVFISRFREMNPKAQLIALSATITNSDDISSWLNAEHIKSLWRPVKLREGVYYKDGIYFSDGDEKSIKKIFRDDIANLVLETVFEGGQALIFVNARKYAEALAEKLGEVLKKFLSNETPVHYESDIAIEDVGEETDIGKKLKRCLKNGVAFHHAGLTQQQRDKIEKQFKERILKCIVATPTLAAGINLPARRVIVRDLRRYENGCSLYIPVLEVKQMCGRAGRPKYDKEGEAIIIGKRKEEVQWLIDKYFKSEGEIITSKLCNENILRMHILGVIASGYTSTFNILKKFIGSTFYAYTEKRGIDSEIINVISFLNKNGFIEVFGDELLPTVFGKRVAQLYIDPSSGIVLRDALENTKNATSFSYLHAISATQDMHKLRLYLRKGDYEWLNEEVEKRREEFILPIPDNGYEWFLSEVKNALLLEDWIQERKDGWL
ncbi:MAG: DEAD/DEAH box helicase, partial [Candidatus Thermoplasmatota archaeon]